MVDSTAPHVRMTHGYRRRFGVIGLANTFWYPDPCARGRAACFGAWLRPASPARLGPVRPRTHVAAESTI
jgi:hypothetical protein